MKKKAYSSTARVSIVGLLMLSSYMAPTFAAFTDNNKLKCVFANPIHVFVANKLPTAEPTVQLRARCQAKGHDTGLFTIVPNQEYNFNFCHNVFGKSLYFCHLYWGHKQVVFDVYDEDLFRGNGCRTESGSVDCYWQVKADGVYLGGGQGTKIHDWQ